MSRVEFEGSHSRGYTLVEVLVVVTILGIAGMLIIPSLGQADVLRVQGAVRTLVSDLTYAQADALAYQQQRAVVFDAANNEYTLVAVDDAGIDPEVNALWDPTGPDQQYIVSLSNPAFGLSQLAAVNFGDGIVLIFDELGGPVAGPGSDVPSEGGSVDIIGPQSRFRINVAGFTGAITVAQVALEDDGNAGTGGGGGEGGAGGEDGGEGGGEGGGP
jgi:prepilin-type N-terminal cleavage/methylation domain-containing protein